MEQININIETLKTLCAKHKVARLYAFGSVLTPKFSSQSDIDLSVEFADIDVLDYADNDFLIWKNCFSAKWI